MVCDQNLTNLKIGDEITTITTTKKGLKYGIVYTITEWDEKYKCWIFKTLNGNFIHRLNKEGHGYYFMSKNQTPDFYYTANPLHIKKAKVANKRAVAKNNKILLEKTRRMLLVHPVGGLLKTEYYDREENYRLDTTNDINEMLINYLTDEQIITLKGWLKIKN